MSKVAERKAKLRADLIVRAEEIIAERGVGELRARDLAKDVGCSLGQIYNVFDDLDGLILSVSYRTLSRIDTVMDEAARKAAPKEPVEVMLALAHTYLTFVRENTYLWRSLFEHDLPQGYAVPDWITAGQHLLFRHIEKPLNRYMPKASADEISGTARMLLGAVHGIVTLSVEERVSGLNPKEIEPQLDLLVRTFVKGLAG